jgi:hypothetical protein
MYEYMAMRKTIVATEDLVECHGFEGVYISKNMINDFESAIKRALKATSDVNVLKALEKAAKKNTWKKRAELINNHIK